MPVSRSILVAAVWALGLVAAQGQDLPGPEAAAALESALTAVIARTAPSVVAIARVRKEKPGEVFNLEFRPDPFGRRTVPPIAVAPTDPEFLPNEYGTGVAIDRQGLILTAYHVLAPDSDYYVTTHQRKVYTAQIKAADPRSDLAVLAIETGDLVPIPFGDAAQLRRGQFVVALGNPHAIARDGQASASWGIVANLNRKAPLAPEASDSPGRRTLHQFGTLIQTDARLSLGTSGGPVVNLRGEMVGLSVALAAVAGYEPAAGYAIPIDATFRRVIDTLKQGREVEYGFLGVRPMNLRAQEVRDGHRGARVQTVVPGTPADRFGIRQDDVITAVSGKPIDGSDGLMLEVGRLPAEARIRFTVLRDSALVEIPGCFVAQGNVMPLPADVSDREAALLEPFSCVVNGVRVSRIELGDTVAIFGAGPIGLMHLMLTRIAGAAQVLVIDPVDDRLRRAVELGCDVAINPTQDDVRERIRRETDGRGANVVITACPVPEVQSQAVGLLAPYGRLCLFGALPRGSGNVSFDSNAIHYGNYIVTGSTGGSALDYRTALRLVAGKRMDLTSIISNVYSLGELDTAYQTALAGPAGKVVLLAD